MTCLHILAHNSDIFWDKYKKLVTKMKSFFRQIDWLSLRENWSSRLKVMSLKRQKKNLKSSKWAEIAISSTQSMKCCLTVYPNAWTWPALQKVWYPGQFLQRIGPEFPKNRSNIHQNGPKVHSQAYNQCSVDFSYCFFN